MWGGGCLEESNLGGGESWCDMCSLCKVSGLAWEILLVLPWVPLE